MTSSPGAKPPPRTRQEKALQTRRRILRAAYARFCDEGYAAAKIEDIAQDAQVAVPTVYFTFKTKAAILRDVVGACVVGFDAFTPDLEAHVVEDHETLVRHAFPWFRALEREPEPRRALAHFVGGSLDVLDRMAPLWADLASVRDPEVVMANETAEQRRVEGMQFVIAALVDKAPLVPGLGRKRAVDITLIFTSPEMWRQLTFVRGWSRRKAKRWLVDSLHQQLFGAGSA